MSLAPNASVTVGKVAFARTPLRIVGRTLTFERYGRSIVFRRTGQKWETG